MAGNIYVVDNLERNKSDVVDSRNPLLLFCMCSTDFRSAISCSRWKLLIDSRISNGEWVVQPTDTATLASKQPQEWKTPKGCIEIGHWNRAISFRVHRVNIFSLLRLYEPSCFTFQMERSYHRKPKKKV